MTETISLFIKAAVDDLELADDEKVVKSFEQYNKALEYVRRINSTDDMNKAFEETKKALDSFDPRIQKEISAQVAGFKIAISEIQKQEETLADKRYCAEYFQYIEDPRLAKLNVSTLEAKEARNQTLASEIALNTTEASKLEALNADIMPDGNVSTKGEAMLQGMLFQLSQDCERKITSYKQPFSADLNREVRLALKDFVNRPTQEHMDSCIAAMEKDKTYLKNDKLVGFIERAGVLYPELAKAHGAVVEKAPSQATEASSVNQRFKSELDVSREGAKKEAAAGDENVDRPEIQDTTSQGASPNN